MGRYGLALRLARADITRYTIWHKSHTEPVLPTDNPHLLFLLETDIKALAQFVDILMHCYRFTNQWNRLPPVLDRLEPNIQDPRWSHKIILCRALQIVGLEWDNEEGARRELARLPPIAEVDDVDILTFYLHVNADQLTLKETLDLVDRVIALTDDPGIAFSYGALKGFHSLVLGELHDAEHQIATCIENLRTANLPRLSTFVENRLASSLSMRASIHLLSRDDDTMAVRYAGEARYLFNKLLRETQFTASGEAAIYSEMAETYCFQDDWKNAKHYYDLAMVRHQKQDLYKVLSAKCDIHLDYVNAARQKLREVDVTKLEPAGYTDYAFQAAALALKSGNAEDRDSANIHLDKCRPRWPYFREQRDRYRIALLSQKEPKELAESSRRAGFLSGLLRYVNISPGLFGVSVDVNKVIEDMIADKQDERGPDK